MAEFNWLSEKLVRQLNADLVASHGGPAAAVRDPNLLASALARPQNLLAYSDRTPSIFELAAAYGFGLARNHAFVDGNKRTALMAMYVFIEDNGYAFGGSEAAAAAIVEDVAAGNCDQSGLAAWLSDTCRPK